MPAQVAEIKRVTFLLSLSLGSASLGARVLGTALSPLLQTKSSPSIEAQVRSEFPRPGVRATLTIKNLLYWGSSLPDCMRLENPRWPHWKVSHLPVTH